MRKLRCWDLHWTDEEEERAPGRSEAVGSSMVGFARGESSTDMAVVCGILEEGAIRDSGRHMLELEAT